MFKPRVKSTGYVDAITKSKSGSVVTLAEAKAQCNMSDDEFTADDDLLMQKIKSATSLAEEYIGADILYTTNTLFIQEGEYRDVYVREANLQSITSIEYKDQDDVDQTVSSYKLRKRLSDFMIIFDDYISFNEMTITFVTGWGTSIADEQGATPEFVKEAILVKTNDLYDMERTSITQGVNYSNNRTFQTFLDPYKILRYA